MINVGRFYADNKQKDQFLVYWVSMATVQYERYTKYFENSESFFLVPHTQTFYVPLQLRLAQKSAQI